MTDVSITSSALHDFSVATLVAAGIPADHAATVADVLVFADERGVASHGTMALDHYVHHLQSGGVNPSPNVRVLSEAAAYAVVDADNSLGAVAASFAIRLAIRKAGEAGLALVTVRNSNHFGAGAYYAMLAAQAGMIGEVFSNVPPMMAPTGGKRRMLGNNPLSIAVPAKAHAPLVLDMAMSAAAGGRVIGAAAAGKKIPEGWLLDADGRPTTDPQDFHRGGALVPFGGYKGYGLALAVEAIAGVLSGAGVGTQVTSFRRQPTQPSHTGHTFRVTNIAPFMPLDEFRTRMDFLIDEMKNSPKADGVDEILVPGELEERAVARSRANGIRLAGETYAALVELSSRFKIAPPAISK